MKKKKKKKTKKKKTNKLKKQSNAILCFKLLFLHEEIRLNVNKRRRNVKWIRKMITYHMFLKQNKKRIYKNINSYDILWH